MPVPLVANDLQLLVGLGIAERGLEEETVELGLRQREGALELDRVLRGEDEERLRKLARRAVDGDLRLGHGLEQRGLRLRHRAVDLVDEHDVGEDRSRAELEVPLPLVVDRQPGDVRGLEVGRALDPRRRRALDALRERPREDGLRRSGHVLQQDMSPTGQGGEDEPDLLLLAAHDEVDVLQQLVRDPDSTPDPLAVPPPLGLEAAHGRLNIGSAFIDISLSQGLQG